METRKWTRAAGAVLVITSIIGIASATATGTNAAKSPPTLLTSYIATSAGTSLFNMLNGYEPLIWLGANGKFMPGLAVNWQVKPGNKVITLTLRRNARFSDGTRVDAKAVAGWLNYLNKEIYPGGTSADMGPMLGAQAVGNWTVRLTTKTPNPLLTMAVSSGAINAYWAWVASPACVAKATADPKNSPLNSQTCGAGPYKLDKSNTVFGDHTTFVPNPYYFDKSKVRWGKVVVKIFGDQNAALSALRTGQIDVVMGVDAQTVGATRSAGFKVITTHQGRKDVYFMDHGGIQPALADLRVRQAMNYALDRKRMATLWGSGTRTTSVPNGDPRSDVPKDRNYYPFNLAKAKALLAAAGYAKGFTVKMLCYVGDPITPSWCSEIQKQLAAVNITVTIYTSTSLDAWVKEWQTDTYSLNAWAYSIIFPPTTFYYYMLWPKGALWVDHHGWRDPVMDKLFFKSIRETPVKAEVIWKQMSHRMVTQALFMAIAQTPGFNAYNQKKIRPIAAFNVGVGGEALTQPSDVIQWAPAGG